MTDSEGPDSSIPKLTPLSPTQLAQLYRQLVSERPQWASVSRLYFSAVVRLVEQAHGIREQRRD